MECELVIFNTCTVTHHMSHTMEPLSRGQFGVSYFVPCREIVLLLEVENVLTLYMLEIWKEGCPFLGGSFNTGSTVIMTTCT